MPERLYDVDVQIRVPGNELPKLLATELQIIALIGHACLAIAAPVHGNDILTTDIYSEDSLCLSEVVYPPPNLTGDTSNAVMTTQFPCLLGDAFVNGVFDSLKPVNILAD